MASQDLFHLLNQLQTVEKTFINILMEAAIKLSSLTESNIFVLVETPEERKFAGSSVLCQSYLENGLHHRENDVQLEVDSSRCAVVEKRSVNLDQECGLQNQSKKRGRKRKGPSNGDTKEKNRKVLPSDFHEGDTEGAEEESHGDSAIVGMIAEGVENDANGGEVIIEDIRSLDEGPNETHYDLAEGNADDSRYQEFDLHDDDSSLIHPESDAMAVFGTDADMSFSSEGEMDDTFSGKISALLTLEPSNCFVQNSEEQKLFHSIMYDVARRMVASSDVIQHGPNSPMHKAHFKKCFDQFLNTYLTDFIARVPPEFRVNKKGRVFTPMAIIRKSCNDCFRALLRRKFRQACLASNQPVPFQFH